MALGQGIDRARLTAIGPPSKSDLHPSVRDELGDLMGTLQVLGVGESRHRVESYEACAEV